MTDTPTREQVQEALALYDLAIARQRGTTGANTKIIHAAARLWLEGPTVDEAMIERAAEAIARYWWETGGEWGNLPAPNDDDLACAKVGLRAALEVTDD